MRSPYMLFFEKYEISEDAFVKYQSKIHSDNKCNLSEDLPIDDITNKCNHSVGYIHHIPTEKKNENDTDELEAIPKSKLCCYALNPKKDSKDRPDYCKDSSSHSPLQILDIPYTINYKSLQDDTSRHGSHGRHGRHGS